MKRGFLFVFLTAVIFTSCERTVDTPLDADYSHPYLHELQIFPESFNTDTILVNGQADPQDLITLSFECLVIADRAAGSAAPPTVRFAVRLPAEDELYAQGALLDDGVSPDLGSGDGIYTGRVSFTIRRVEIGNFELSVEGYHDPVIRSNTLLRQIRVFRTNRPPVISDLSAPDTVNLPPPGSLSLISMSIAASDSDGRADIREVFFLSLDSSQPTDHILLFDDGHASENGDSVANDGTYSIIVQLSSSNNPGTYRFEFHAVDRSGAASDSLLHTLTVVGPE